MTSVIPLGTLQPVAIREAWPSEDDNFTPWLAEPDYLKELGNVLDIELETEAVEYRIGSFKADILAKAVNEPDHRVIIENQFGRTNHGHLGQILTYLAGIENAKTVVWIAEEIQSDHRAAIDWLNANTAEDFSFFAIEVQLWRIGDSPPAPQFHVVASPNEWTKSARSATREASEPALTERHNVYLSYWASFSEYLKANRSTFRIRRTNKDHWFPFGIGRANFVLNALLSTEKKRIGVELFLQNDPAKVAFKTLLSDKANIESDFGEQLEWQELPGKKGARVVVYKQGVDLANEVQRPELHQWMMTRMDKFKAVLGPRVKTLSFSAEREADTVVTP